MKKFYVFLNTENGALVLISANNPDFMFYEESHSQIKNGNRKECIQFMEQYQEDYLIPDEVFNVHLLN